MIRGSWIIWSRKWLRARAGRDGSSDDRRALQSLDSAGARRGTHKMSEARKRRPRDPEGTREAILEAARTRLAADGPEGLSLSEVAHLAGVNRGTAYQHF